MRLLFVVHPEEYAKANAEGNFFQPPPSLSNQYLSDMILRSFLERHLPKQILQSVESELINLGARAIDELSKLADEVEQNQPILINYDPWGKRVDKVVTSPAWKKLKDIAAEEGLVNLGYEGQFSEYSRIIQFAKIYLYTPSSAMYTCPLAMTDGAAKLLEIYGDESLKDTYIPRLTSRNPEEFIVSGQWMTERPGGSDVSGSETLAIKSDDGWVLYGPKWFTSAITGEVAMMLGKVVEDNMGEIVVDDRLSLFMLEIYKEGLPNNLRIHKLKDKLGTRGLPTAELTLDGVPAKMIGERGKGVRQIATMLNITRLYNAVSTVAYMRRAYAIAEDYASRRMAFGKPLNELPLHQRVLREAKQELKRCFELAFFVVQLRGRVEAGVASDMDLLLERLLTPIAKLYTAKKGVVMISEMLEAMGGAGYLEDTGFPRLLRDAQVFTIWEGTTNVLSLDVLRVHRKEDGIRKWVQWLRDQTDDTKVLLHVDHVVSILSDSERLEENARDLSFAIADATIAFISTTGDS